MRNGPAWDVIAHGMGKRRNGRIEKDIRRKIPHQGDTGTGELLASDGVMMTFDVRILPLMVESVNSGRVHMRRPADCVLASHLFIGKQSDAYV